LQYTKFALAVLSFNRFGKSSVSAVHRLFAKTPLFCVLLPFLAALCVWLVVRTSCALKPPKTAFIQRFCISRAGFPGVSRSNVTYSARARAEHNTTQHNTASTNNKLFVPFFYSKKEANIAKKSQKHVKTLRKSAANAMFLG
jgi:hypothetical protein